MYSIISFLKILVWTANEGKMESLKTTLKNGKHTVENSQNNNRKYIKITLNRSLAIIRLQS